MQGGDTGVTREAALPAFAKFDKTTKTFPPTGVWFCDAGPPGRAPAVLWP